MADNTKIEWSDATWNPITGCSVVSPGCTNCYAMKLAGTRLKNEPSRVGLTKPGKSGPVWTGEVRFNEQWLDQPLRWKRPRRIFVCAHGDLFAENVPDEWIDRVFAVMLLAGHHIYQVLTKRHERMRAYIALRSVPDERGYPAANIRAHVNTWLNDPIWRQKHRDWARLVPEGQNLFSMSWPLPNVWLGVSVEDQKRADERIPALLATPAAVRWISAEPLLALVDFTRVQIIPPPYRRSGVHLNALTGRCVESGLPYHSQWDGEGSLPLEPGPHLDWVVVGGESGPGARPMHPDWARSIRDQCDAANVPFFFKQWGNWSPCTLETDEQGQPSAAYPMVGCVDEYVHTGDQEALFWNGSDWVTWVHLSKLPAIGVRNVGKARAGRMLDGVEHNGFPEVQS